jgi:hypothetical protein
MRIRLPTKAAPNELSATLQLALQDGHARPAEFQAARDVLRACDLPLGNPVLARIQPIVDSFEPLARQVRGQGANYAHHTVHLLDALAGSDLRRGVKSQIGEVLRLPPGEAAGVLEVLSDPPAWMGTGTVKAREYARIMRDRPADDYLAFRADLERLFEAAPEISAPHAPYGPLSFAHLFQRAPAADRRQVIDLAIEAQSTPDRRTSLRTLCATLLQTASRERAAHARGLTAPAPAAADLSLLRSTVPFWVLDRWPGHGPIEISPQDFQRMQRNVPAHELARLPFRLTGTELPPLPATPRVPHPHDGLVGRDLVHFDTAGLHVLDADGDTPMGNTPAPVFDYRAARRAEALRPRVNRENVMTEAQICWTEQAIEALRETVGELRAEPKVLLDEIANYAQTHFSRSPEFTTPRGRTGGELPNALRTLQGGWRPGDYSASLQDNEQFSFAAGGGIGTGELCALVWQAIATYGSKLPVDERVKEIELMRHALVMALGQCIEDDGHRVCNVGVTQRLVRFLQKRFPEVGEEPMATAGELLCAFGRELAMELDKQKQETPSEERLAEWVQDVRLRADELYASNDGQPESTRRANQREHAALERDLVIFAHQQFGVTVPPRAD